MRARRRRGWPGFVAAGCILLCCGCGRPAAPSGGGGEAGGERLIVLLDLNYTLVENREETIRAGAGGVDRRLARERYRSWLLELIGPHRVILITALPESRKARTLLRIEESAGWRPDEAYFNEKDLPPPECKRDILERYVFPKHGAPRDGTRYAAIESNPRTAAMYASLGIPCLRVWDLGRYRPGDGDSARCPGDTADGTDRGGGR